MRRIEIEVGGQWVENPVMYLPGVVATATLLEDRAPRACQALWDMLPIETRTVHAFNAGQTWRTEQNYNLSPDGVSENPPDGPFEVGAIAHLNIPDIPLYKIFFIYGNSRTTRPHSMSIIGRVDESLEELINMSRRILYEGPKNLTIRRKA